MITRSIALAVLGLLTARELQAQDRPSPTTSALSWMLERAADDGAADPAARLRSRAEHAVTQLRAAITTKAKQPATADRFANGATALVQSRSATHDPRAVLEAAGRAEAEAITTTVADRLQQRFRTEGRSLDSVAAGERAETVRRFVADQRFAADDNADAQRFLRSIQEDLRGTKLPEERARVIFDKARIMAADPTPAERPPPAKVASELGSLKSGLAKQDAALANGLADAIARLGNGDAASIAAAVGAVDSAVLSARKVAPDLLKSIDALERLGVIGPTSAGLIEGVARFDTALSIVQGSLAISMANPAGVVQVLEGLADLMGSSKGGGKAQDGRTPFLTTIGTRLDEVATLVEESNRKLDRLQESLDRLRIEMAVSFERQEREFERLREALTSLVANASFQDFESCVLIEDVLRKANRLQVATSPAGVLTVKIGGDWRERLRQLRAEPAGDRNRPPLLLQECMRAMLRLFGTDQAASVSKPFVVPAAPDGDPSRGVAGRHTMLVQALLAELRAGSGSAVTPQGLMRYVALAPWLDRPSEAARLWRRVGVGEAVATGAPAVEPEVFLRRERIDADRLRVVARVVLYLAPLFWLEGVGPVAVAGSAPPDHPGVRVLTNLAGLLERSLTDEAMTDGLVAVPAAMALHARLVAEHLKRFDEAAEQRGALDALASGAEARTSSAAELAWREEALLVARAALLAVEAVLGATEGLRRQAIEYELHRSLQPTDSTVNGAHGPARAHLAEEWRIGLAGAAVARGARRWIDARGQARDTYAELIRGSSFAWQLDRPDVRDHLYDPAACRTSDGAEAAWIARSPQRDALLSLCGRLAAATAAKLPVRFTGYEVELPRFGLPGPPSADRVRDLRQLVGETRLVLQLARSTVIDDGSDRPLVIAQR